MGCHATPGPPLPTVEWNTTEDARTILIDRQAALESVQTQLKFRITPPPPDDQGRKTQGETHSLDAALVIRGEHHLRLRAWKLGQTVFDLTINPDGTFIVASDEMKKRAPDAEQNLAQLADQLTAMLRGPDWATARFDAGPPLMARWPHASSMIDHRSLTPMRYTLVGDKPDQQVRLQTRYADYGNGLWFSRILATGPFGTIELNFYDTELNGELNPRAFNPPRRATKIQTEPKTVSDTVSGGVSAEGSR